MRKIVKAAWHGMEKDMLQNATKLDGVMLVGSIE